MWLFQASLLLDVPHATRLGYRLLRQPCLFSSKYTRGDMDSINIE